MNRYFEFSGSIPGGESFIVDIEAHDEESASKLGIERMSSRFLVSTEDICDVSIKELVPIFITIDRDDNGF